MMIGRFVRVETVMGAADGADNLDVFIRVVIGLTWLGCLVGIIGCVWFAVYWFGGFRSLFQRWSAKRDYGARGPDGNQSGLRTDGSAGGSGHDVAVASESFADIGDLGWVDYDVSPGVLVRRPDGSEVYVTQANFPSCSAQRGIYQFYHRGGHWHGEYMEPGYYAHPFWEYRPVEGGTNKPDGA